MSQPEIGTGYGDQNAIPSSAAEPLRVLPIIDISRLQSSDAKSIADVVTEIHQAATEVGFFYIVGHGVPEETTERMRSECSATPLMAGRIASSEMLPWPHPLPHLTCSRLEITGDGHGTGQHGNT